MIFRSFSDAIQQDMQAGKVEVIDVKVIDKKDRPSEIEIIMQHKETKKVASLRITKPATDNPKFDLENALIQNVLVKRHRTFYSAQYFECKAIVLIDKGNHENRAIIYTEVA